MKKRILTAAVCVPLAVVVLSFCPTWVTRAFIAFFCCVGMYELLSVMKLSRHRGIVAVAELFAFAAPSFFYMGDAMWLFAVLIGYAFLLVLIQLLFNRVLKFERVAYLLCTSVMIIVPIASLGYLIALPVHGRFYIYLALVIAWLADIGAYFIGTFFGKHKLCPNISPKKTVEGLCGGLIAAVVFSLVAAVVYQTVCLDPLGLQVNYWLVAVIALCLSPLSVIGDLLCSVIKRQSGIKDFGKLFPGHGGVLDRFDSLIFVAPILYILCVYTPIVL